MSTASKQFLRSLPRTVSPSVQSRPLLSHSLRTLRSPNFAFPAFHTSATRMTVHEIKSKADFNKICEENKIVLIDCSAEWCGPCKMISPIFEKLSNEEQNSKIYFAKFDVDEVPDLAQELGIRAMPTFKAIKNGEKTDEMLGANPQGLTALVSKLLA